MFAAFLEGGDGCHLLQGPLGLGRQQDISRAPFSEAGWALRWVWDTHRDPNFKE